MQHQSSVRMLVKISGGLSPAVNIFGIKSITWLIKQSVKNWIKNYGLNIITDVSFVCAIITAITIITALMW